MSAPPLLIDRIMTVMEYAFDPAFGEAWNRRQVADALTLPSTHALVIDSHGALIPARQHAPIVGPGNPAIGGFVLTRHVLDEEELLLIAVAPQYRRRGLASALIEYMIAAARQRGVTRIYLEMRKGNPAIALYQKVGFEPIGERPNYYRMANGERAHAITFGLSV